MSLDKSVGKFIFSFGARYRSNLYENIPYLIEPNI